jgi:hypothetical protein
MIKVLIWIDLNAQSVCTYQLWNFLFLWCSTWLEDSRDYKIVIFGLTKLKIWIKQVNRRFDSNLKIDSNWAHKIWSLIVLLDSRCSKDSNGILFVIFGSMKRKIWILQDWVEIWLEISIWIGSIRNRATWQLFISRYRFGWITDLGRRIEMEWTHQI